MTHQDSLSLTLSGSSDLELTVTRNGKLTTRLDGQMAGEIELKEDQTDILFHLAEAVRLRGYGSAFERDDAVTEASRLVYVFERREIPFAFGLGSEPVPEDLSLLVREMGGLISF